MARHRIYHLHERDIFIKVGGLMQPQMFLLVFSLMWIAFSLTG